MVESFDQLHRRSPSTPSQSPQQHHDRRRSGSSRRSRRRRPSFPFPHTDLLLLGAAAVIATALMAAAAAAMGTEEARMYDRNLQHFSPEGRLYQVCVSVCVSPR